MVVVVEWVRVNSQICSAVAEPENKAFVPVPAVPLVAGVMLEVKAVPSIRTIISFEPLANDT